MKTVIVEDHQIIRSYLEHYLFTHFSTYHVTLITTFTSNLKEEIVAKKPELLILDISLECVDTMDIFTWLKTKLPNTYFIIYTMHNISSYRNFFYNAGAHAYILKEDGEQELKDVIKTILTGQKVFPKANNAELDEYRLNQLTFTEQEKSLLNVLLSTQETEEIVKQIKLSKTEILNLRRRLIEKSGAKNTQELLNFTIDYNWIR